jgi:hypothetical protein
MKQGILSFATALALLAIGCAATEEASVQTAHQVTAPVELRLEIDEQNRVHFGGQTISGQSPEDLMANLEAPLREAVGLAHRDGREVLAVLAPEGKTLWQYVVAAFAACDKVGIDNIGFAPVRPAPAD